MTNTKKPDVPVDESLAGLPPMKMHVAWDQDEILNAKTTHGITIRMAASDRVFTTGKAPSPLEVFVAALGGCPAQEILAVMNAKQEVVKHLEVEITGNRRATPPTIFDTLHVTFILTGGIDDEYACGIIRDVMTRRCPVAVSFGRASYVTWDYRIIPK